MPHDGAAALTSGWAGASATCCTRHRGARTVRLSDDARISAQREPGRGRRSPTTRTWSDAAIAGRRVRFVAGPSLDVFACGSAHCITYTARAVAGRTTHAKPAPLADWRIVPLPLADLNNLFATSDGARVTSSIWWPDSTLPIDSSPRSFFLPEQPAAAADRDIGAALPPSSRLGQADGGAGGVQTRTATAT